MGLAFRAALNDAGLRLRQAIVWVKDVFVMGRQDYHWRHEDILYGWKDGAAHYFVDDRTLDTVWEIPRPKRSEHHPTTKPLELVARALRNSTRPGQTALDVFMGSGSTLIACEQLGRRCLGVEIDPRYADVAVFRWQDVTGRGAVLDGDGRSFEQVAEERLPAREKDPGASGVEGERNQ